MGRQKRDRERRKRRSICDFWLTIDDVSKHQIPNSASAALAGVWSLGNWSFFEIWTLVIGTWSFSAAWSFHSFLSASIGSTFAARRAGIKHAKAATARRMRETAATVRIASGRKP